MTSISSSVIPPQATSNASQTVAQAQSSSPSLSGRTPPLSSGPSPAPARSYASATKKQSSPTSATNTSIPPGAVGGSNLPHHGKADSISPLNGKGPITPAVPALGPPTIVNGNTAASITSTPIEHGRKASVTIDKAGASGYLPNGGPVGGKPTGGSNIQFGDINNAGSPALANALPHLSQPSASLAVNQTPNPRITSPATSPSPIPQPAASGGRPPSVLQGHGNGLSFGSIDDSNRPLRPPNMPSSQLTPGPQHLRRESSQSAHSDLSNPSMGPNPMRGGFPQQSGRGRGFNPPQYSQQMNYSHGPGFRAPSQPRGAPNVPSPYSQQGRPLPPGYPNSPHQPARSPALPHSQPTHTPQLGQVPIPNQQMLQTYGGYPQPMGAQQVKPQSSSSSPLNQQSLQKNTTFSLSDMPQAVQPLDLSPAGGNFEQLLTSLKQAQFMMSQGFDTNYTTAMYHQYGIPTGHYMPPTSPRPHHPMPPQTQQPYMQGQYANASQPPSMSRTPSAMSMPTERPPSTLGKSQTPGPHPVTSNTPVSSRPTNSPAPKSAFQVPPRKSAGIVIKDPNSGAVKTFNQQSPSPAPSTQSPAAASATPTPPPPISNDSQHNRSESKSVKTNEEKRNDMRDAIARKLEEDKAEERRQKEEEAAKVEAEMQEANAKLLKEKEEAEAKQLAAAKAQMEVEEAASKAKNDAALAQDAIDKAKAEEDEIARKEREEEEEFARIEAEMQRKEREAEERYQQKKKAEADEKARKDAAAAKTLDEDMKRAEREAEEAEEARLKKLEEYEGDTSKKESRAMFAALRKDGSATPASDTLSAADTPGESGADTPVSESSMAPPKATTGKQKPAALKLETVKPVEPPQPSAQLLSLRSARRITSINDVVYPPTIASPNPALNTTAPMGKFRYEQNFMIQFKPVFLEKPSEDWTERIKETLGSDEPPSARTGSARSSTMGPRQLSTKGPNVQNVVNPGRMGEFGGGGVRTLPSGTTSSQRFQQSTMHLTNQGRTGQMQNPLAPFISGRPSGFPIGGAQKPERVPSSTGMASHPHSPRNNPSQRVSSRTSKGGRTRENDKDAKTMPLTAGTTLKPIEVTASGWKPTSVGQGVTGLAGPAPGGDGYMAPDVVQRKVKSNLNKMTPNNFDRISDQILAIAAQSKDETDGRTLRQVIQLTFEKATDEAHWAEMYAQFCKRMLESMNPEIKDESILDKKGEIVTGGALFRKYLLTRCQTEFERGWKINLPEKPEGETEEAVMLSDEYYAAAAAKRRGLGLVRFIGELYKLTMLTERIMHECVKKLVDYEGTPDEAEVESLTSLLKTIGQNLDASERGRQLMDVYFARINIMMDAPGLPSRLKFMLMDIGDLRKKNWQGKGDTSKGPTTLEAVRAEAAAAEREKEVQRQADAGARRAAGGRPPLGRGDVRAFSGGGGQYGMMPPPDYQRNTVGMDDIRRLGRGGSSRQPSQAGPTVLGPPSMFSSRGSNPRKPISTSGMARAGEDSGTSSRTGTPPAQKERKEKEEKEAAAKHQNTFSALAVLDNGSEPADPASPPSTGSSPPTTKLKPAERQRSKSPLGNKDNDENQGEQGEAS